MAQKMNKRSNSENNNISSKNKLAKINDQNINDIINIDEYSYAQNNLAWCYKHGKGVEKDQKKAIELYTLSANSGNSSAQNKLAIYYKNSDGVEKS